MHSAPPLGRLLVTSGLLTQQALDEVLAVQKTDGRRLGELLEEKGLVRPHQLAQFLSHQLACPWVSLQRVEIAREAVAMLPRAIALKHHMVPVHLRTSKGATALYVAMDDPTDDVALSEAAAAARMPVKAMVALPSEIRTHLEQHYGVANAPSSPPPPMRERTPSYAGVTSITMKEDGPRLPSRPPKPPPPPVRSAPPPPRDEPSVLDVVEVIEDGPGSRPSPSAKVLVIVDAAQRGAEVSPSAAETSERFLVSVRSAAARFGAEAIGITLDNAASATAKESPCALVVTEDIYGVERSGLDRLALDAGAVLLVSSNAFEERQLEGLLEGAIKQWRRSSYEKGSILEGRYELLRDLGGRFPGSRWEVRHLRTARRSMLKVGLRAAHDESDAEAVRREQMALAKVHHPGAVDLRDAGNTELGDPYIVVEMIEGRTLEGLVAARGALEPDEACAIVRQVAEVLAAAHEEGVRHGDVRPENVLIVRDPWGIERAKLIHWESAVVMESGTEAERGAMDVAVDLAGLGACAFLALAGRTRAEGEDVRSIRSGKWAALELSIPLATVIARTLPGAGADRFASAKELLEALDAALPKQGEAIALLDAKPEKRGTSMRPSGRPPGPPSPNAEAPPPPPPVDKNASELRRFPRAPYRTPVRVEVPGIGAIDGRSEDISEGGLFVVTRGKIADGAQVTVRFALPIDGKVVSEAGTVRWSRAPSSGDGGAARAIGIELSSPGAESTKQIARYISFMAS